MSDVNSGHSDEGLLPVEGWRGLAALMVLATHWAPALHWRNPLTDFGFTGVDVFFVISGFVFAPALLGRQHPALGAYAVRRIMRIYPAYLVALAVYAALVAWQGRPLLYLGEHLLMAHVQNREMAFYYSPPFWSLPSELEFYALVPLLGWLFSRAPAGSFAVLAVAALIARAILVAQADAVTQNSAYVLLHHLPGLLVEFLMGAWAWQQHERSAWNPRRRGLWAAAGAIIVIVCGGVHHLLETRATGPDWRHGQVGLAVAAGFALILAATAGIPVRGGMALLCRWCGRLSYSVYLLHMAWVVPITAWVVNWGAGAAALMAVLGLGASAFLVHRLVEDPLRRWARRIARPQKTSVSPG